MERKPLSPLNGGKPQTPPQQVESDSSSDDKENGHHTTKTTAAVNTFLESTDIGTQACPSNKSIVTATDQNLVSPPTPVALSKEKLVSESSEQYFTALSCDGTQKVESEFVISKAEPETASVECSSTAPSSLASATYETASDGATSDSLYATVASSFSNMPNQTSTSYVTAEDTKIPPSQATLYNVDSADIFDDDTVLPPCKQSAQTSIQTVSVSPPLPLPTVQEDEPLSCITNEPADGADLRTHTSSTVMPTVNKQSSCDTLSGTTISERSSSASVLPKRVQGTSNLLESDSASRSEVSFDLATEEQRGRLRHQLVAVDEESPSLQRAYLQPELVQSDISTVPQVRSVGDGWSTTSSVTTVEAFAGATVRDESAWNLVPPSAAILPQISQESTEAAGVSQTDKNTGDSSDSSASASKESPKPSNSDKQQQLDSGAFPNSKKEEYLVLGEDEENLIDLTENLPKQPEHIPIPIKCEAECIDAEVIQIASDIEKGIETPEPADSVQVKVEDTEQIDILIPEEKENTQSYHEQETVPVETLKHEKEKLNTTVVLESKFERENRTEENTEQLTSVTKENTERDLPELSNPQPVNNKLLEPHKDTKIVCVNGDAIDPDVGVVKKASTKEYLNNNLEIKTYLTDPLGKDLFKPNETNQIEKFINDDKKEKVEKDTVCNLSSSIENVEYQNHLTKSKEILQENLALKKMADIETHTEISNLKLQLNAAQQTIASLELEIHQKEEIIIKTQAEYMKSEQALKNENKQLKEKLKENSKIIEKDEAKDLEEALKEAQAREQKALNALNARTEAEANYEKKILHYERLLKEKVIDLQKHKEDHETVARHLANIELAFSDVHQKYERTKAVLEGFKSNEETLRQNLQLLDEKYKLNEEKYMALKGHAKAQIDKSNKSLMEMKEKYDAELCKLRSIVKRLEIKCTSLDTALEQKTRECDELSALCDDLTGKNV